MTISPARIAEIRDLMDSEHRTHGQLDAVVDELLIDAERAEKRATLAEGALHQMLGDWRRAYRAWQSARQRARVLSAEVTRKAPLLGEYAERTIKAERAVDLLAGSHRRAEQAEGRVAELEAELGGRDEAARERWIEKQLAETGIRAMDFRNGMEMELEPARELLAYQVAAARTMLGDAPNYTETKLSWDVKVAESPETYTIVIQRHAPGALTPHKARQKAEARVAELEAERNGVRAAALAEAAAWFENQAAAEVDGYRARVMRGAANDIRRLAETEVAR